MLPLQTTSPTTEPGPALSPQSLSSADEFAVGLARLNPHGEVLAHNACWTRLLGGAEVGVHLALLVHPEDVGSWADLVERMATQPAGGESGPQPLRFVHPDSGLRWLELRCTRHADHISVVAQDITHSQRQLTCAQVEARSLRSLVNGQPGMVFRGRNDREWSMEVVSHGCLDLTGYPAESLCNGRLVHYSSLIVDDDIDYVWDSVQEALRSRQPYTLAYRIRCADGQLRKVLEKGQGVYSASGEVLAIEGAIFELTAAVLDRLESFRSSVDS